MLITGEGGSNSTPGEAAASGTGPGPFCDLRKINLASVCRIRYRLPILNTAGPKNVLEGVQIEAMLKCAVDKPRWIADIML